MKVKNKVSCVYVVCSVLVFFMMFSVQAFAQCVTCASSDTSSRSVTYQPSSSGGKEHQARADSLNLAGVCRSSLKDIPSGEAGGSLFTAVSDAKLEVEPILIMQIAEKHPALLGVFAIGAIAQTLDDCQLKCQNRYSAEYAQCRGDKLCQDRAVDRRNECRYICNQRNQRKPRTKRKQRRRSAA